MDQWILMRISLKGLLLLRDLAEKESADTKIIEALEDAIKNTGWTQ